MTPPCGVPVSEWLSCCPSRTPAASHLSMLRRITPSRTRWSRIVRSWECASESKKLLMSTSSTQPPPPSKSTLPRLASAVCAESARTDSRASSPESPARRPPPAPSLPRVEAPCPRRSVCRCGRSAPVALWNRRPVAPAVPCSVPALKRSSSEVEVVLQLLLVLRPRLAVHPRCAVLARATERLAQKLHVDVVSQAQRTPAPALPAPVPLSAEVSLRPCSQESVSPSSFPPAVP